MRPIIFLSALLLAACSQSQDSHRQRESAEGVSSSAKAKPSLSPAAPVNLTYRVESAPAGQSQRVDLTVNTRLTGGSLLVEVAKQEGVELIGNSAQRIDLAAAPQPIELQMQAVQFGSGEHYFVLLLTVETGMGPMSRSFRIDLTPAADGVAP